MFTWMEATSWTFLPAAGGLQDQDELLMENLYALRVYITKVKTKKV